MTLIEKLCRSLAFHVVETELTLSMSQGAPPEYQEAIDTAKALIEEAGFDIDVLYPPEDRTVIVEFEEGEDDDVDTRH